MAKRWVHVELDQEVAQALRTMAERELREPRKQASVLIFEGLRRAGLLEDRAGGPDSAR